MRTGIRAVDAKCELGLQRLGEQEAAGDAGEHQFDPQGAEAVDDPEAGLGVERIAFQRVGDLFAEGDEGVEDAEQACGAGG